jgi:hypothetical protein
VSANGTLVEAKMWTFTLESTHFNAFTLTTVEMANLALTQTKWIAVYIPGLSCICDIRVPGWVDGGEMVGLLFRLHSASLKQVAVTSLCSLKEQECIHKIKNKADQ